MFEMPRERWNARLKETGTEWIIPCSFVTQLTVPYIARNWISFVIN